MKPSTIWPPGPWDENKYGNGCNHGKELNYESND